MLWVPRTSSRRRSSSNCYQSGFPTYYLILKKLNAGDNTIKIENGVIDKIEILPISEAILGINNHLFVDKTHVFLEKTLLTSDESLKLIIDNSDLKAI
jgi:hypothetical protein